MNKTETSEKAHSFCGKSVPNYWNENKLWTKPISLQSNMLANSLSYWKYTQENTPYYNNNNSERLKKTVMCAYFVPTPDCVTLTTLNFLMLLDM